MKFFVYVVVLFFIVIPGCKYPSCDGPDGFTNTYNIQSLRLNILLPNNNEADTFKFNDVSFRIEIADRNTGAYKNGFKFNFAIVKNAYACSPGPAYTDEIIEDIVITSNADYDEQHLSGANLADLFEVYAAGYHNYAALNGGTNAVTLVDFISNHYRSDDFLDLRLASTPTIAKNHVFTINYTHVGGEEFVMISQELAFQ
ncbi:MAG: hypothetical protein OEY58_22850 [Gammaproteobacteria bacterium]|nr:hypothetical protein [Gammaproteobacteria bacterium]